MSAAEPRAAAPSAVVPHNRPWLLAEDIDAVTASIATGWLAPGPAVATLERELARLHDGGAACAVSSGTAALFVALQAAGVQRGDQVAAPTYVCTAVLNAIALCGAEPVLLDVDSGSFNIDPSALAALHRKPRAVIAVHTYGAPADIDALSPHAEIIIEDCCQSLGGRFADGRPLGALGDAAICSFYATKLVTGGHGGMVYARSGSIAAAARDYIMFDGRPSWRPRFNFQLTDFQAALIARQLTRLPAIGARRRSLVQAYRAAAPAGYAPQDGMGAGVMPYRFVLSAPDSDSRERLRLHLAAAGVTAIVPLEPGELLHRQLGLKPDAFPRAERIAATTLSIPLYPALSDDEVERIVAALRSAPSP